MLYILNNLGAKHIFDVSWIDSERVRIRRIWTNQKGGFRPHILSGLGKLLIEEKLLGIPMGLSIRHFSSESGNAQYVEAIYPHTFESDGKSFVAEYVTNTYRLDKVCYGDTYVCPAWMVQFLHYEDEADDPWFRWSVFTEPTAPEGYRPLLKTTINPIRDLPDVIVDPWAVHGEDPIKKPNLGDNK